MRIVKVEVLKIDYDFNLLCPPLNIVVVVVIVIDINDHLNLFYRFQALRGNSSGPSGIHKETAGAVKKNSHAERGSNKYATPLG